MRKLDIEAYHPITLSHIDYVHFSFTRLVPSLDPPLIFPEFEVNIIEAEVHADLQGRLILEVMTKPLPEGEIPPEELPVLSFTFTLVAYFRCAKVDQAQEVLEAFMAGEAPSLLAWPYVRGFVADMVNRAGLPSYHLPLLQIRISADTDAAPAADLHVPAAEE